MAYENTHLWAASEISGRIENSTLKKQLSENMDDYYFGAVFPDTLSYSKDKKIRAIADFLHGETGSPSNKVVLDLLDSAQKTRDRKSLALSCGFLTHCAMDIVLHPIVVYFSGYKPGNNRRQAAQSSYLHWHYETWLDQRFNKAFFVDRIINPAAARNPALAAVLNISGQLIFDSVRRQISFFKRTRQRRFYTAYRMLNKIGLIEKKYLGGFYANLDVDGRRLSEELQYRDIVSGERKNVSLEALMDTGIEMGVQLVEGAYDYYCGNISRPHCERILIGNSLDTGQAGKTKADVVYSVDIEQ